MAEFANSPAISAHMAASEHKCRTSLHDGRQQTGLVGYVIFQIRVLNQKYFTGRGGESLPYRVTLSHRTRLVNCPHLYRRFVHMTPHKIGDHFARAVRGIAFNDDDFFGHTSKRLRPHTLKQRGDGTRFVINGNDDRYFHAYVEPVYGEG